MRLEVQSVGSNMSELRVNGTVFLFSYKTPVAYEDISTGTCYHTNEFFSKTTSKHINKWLAGRKSHELEQHQIETLLGLM